MELKTCIHGIENSPKLAWPCGPMDKASDFESEDCGFDPHHGRFFFSFLLTRTMSRVMLKNDAKFVVSRERLRRMGGRVKKYGTGIIQVRGTV